MYEIFAIRKYPSVQCIHSTLPYPTLPNPVTSLYQAPFWRHCHGKHGAHVHRKAYAWSRARGRMYMHNAHVCTYACTCMRFTLHSELRAYPSYGHSPRRRCPDKGGLSVPGFTDSPLVSLRSTSNHRASTLLRINTHILPLLQQDACTAVTATPATATARSGPRTGQECAKKSSPCHCTDTHLRC